jgi:hypothetical protein
MKKRGLYHFKIFISLVVLSLIVFFSVKVISYFSSLVKQDEFNTFHSELENSILQVKGKIGKIQEMDIYFPNKINKIYIMDTSKALYKLNYDEEVMVDDSISSKAENNVFLFSEDKLQDSFKVDGLNIKTPHYICINNTDNSKLKLEGIANGVHVSLENKENDCTKPILVREVVTTLSGNREEFIQNLEKFSKYINNKERIFIDYEIKYNPFFDYTKINISVSAEIPPPIENFEFYEYIPKCLVKNAADLSLDTEANILRDDPLIMWNFGTADLKAEEIIHIREKKKISQACEKLLAFFAKGDGSLLSSGIIGGEVSPLENSDKDEKYNFDDLLPLDTDNDGFHDEYELKYLFDLNDPNYPGEFLILGDDNPIDYSHVTSPFEPIDKDLDGLTDYREYKYGTDPWKNDTEEDLVDDRNEFFFKLDPNCKDSERSSGILPDKFMWWDLPCKGDGMSDSIELKYNELSKNVPLTLYQEVEDIDFPTEDEIDRNGLNPHRDDAYEDFDDDGVPNIEEIGFGLNPTLPDTGNYGISDYDKAVMCSKEKCTDYSSDFLEQVKCCEICSLNKPGNACHGGCWSVGGKTPCIPVVISNGANYEQKKSEVCPSYCEDTLPYLCEFCDCELDEGECEDD